MLEAIAVNCPESDIQGKVSMIKTYWRDNPRDILHRTASEAVGEEKYFCLAGSMCWLGKANLCQLQALVKIHNPYFATVNGIIVDSEETKQALNRDFDATIK